MRASDQGRQSRGENAKAIKQLNTETNNQISC
jgi:hypothetical protein